MSTYNALIVGLLAGAAALADELPGLGEALAREDAAAVSFTILPDGSGLPAGGGTAREGEAVYRRTCSACHGAGGEGALNDRLVGGQGSIGGEQPLKTVGSYWPYATTVFDYIRRAMPYAAPGSLDNDELYAVTAYVLYLNGIVDEGMRLDAGTLPAVRMPNRDNFDPAWSPGDAGEE